ncbi:phasin family protein [Thioalkalivibrio sp. HK1]|uniref:phasin family protein n=1 Tax=Thioalkalivibrio sp. HK1 TaxID=1469245 RepID=UPI0018CC6E48|nr:phasin family protein [Thioalkalivibrio sp. HK1]
MSEKKKEAAVMGGVQYPFKNDQAVGFYNAMLEQTIRTNRVIARGVERIAREQMEWTETAMESTRSFAGVKQPSEALALQTDIAMSMSESFVASAGRIAEIQRETGSEMKDILVDSIKAFNDSLPKTT